MPKVSEVKGCEGCPLQRLFPNRNFIPAKLGPSLRLSVAEAGGKEEEDNGEPLVGPSGRIFDNLCRKAGVSRDSLSISNTLSCRPPNNVYPTDVPARAYCTPKEGEEIVEHCYKHHLKPLIASRPWTRIDAWGNHALEVLTGETGGIMRWRGSPLPLKGENKPRVMPLLHPSYLIRDQVMMNPTISDLMKGLQTPPEYYNITPTIEDVENFKYRRFSLDIETNGFTKEIICVGICGEPYHAMCIPFRGAYIKEIKRILENAEEVITHNGISFDIPILCEALGLKWIHEK